jgi:hypothetical protein
MSAALSLALGTSARCKVEPYVGAGWLIGLKFLIGAAPEDIDLNVEGPAPVERATNAGRKEKN